MYNSYKTLQSSQPSLLPPSAVHNPTTSFNLFLLHRILLLLRFSVTSSLKFTSRSMATAIPPLWNSIATNIRPILRTHPNLTSCHLSTALLIQVENTAL